VLRNLSADELDVRQGAIFVHPGIYSFYDCKGKEHTKTRGFKIDFARDFFMRDIVRAWRAGDKYIYIDKKGNREQVSPDQAARIRRKTELWIFVRREPNATRSAIRSAQSNLFSFR
jgi:hypothetical protein